MTTILNGCGTLANATRLLTLLCALLLAAPMARAQAEDSVNDLRRENDALRERIAQLEAQLSQARKRTNDLEQENAELKRRLAARDAAPAQPGQPAPADPNAPPSPGEPEFAEISEEPAESPDAMLEWLRREYEQHFEGVQYGTDAEHRAYIAEVNRWLRTQNRSLRKPVDWTIRVEEIVPADNPRQGYVLEFRVVEPRTQRPYSEQVWKANIPRPFGDRIQQTPDQVFWRLAGEMVTKPNVDAKRAKPNPFGYPKWIGPFLEFGFELNVRSLTPVE